MRRWFTIVLIFLFLFMFGTVKGAYAQSPAKLIGGIGLAGLGIFLAVDGFRLVEVTERVKKTRRIAGPNQNPSIDTSDWTWSAEQAGTDYPWYVDSSGLLENTGDTPLDNVKIYLDYYDSSGSLIARGYCYPDIYWLDDFPVGEKDSWDDFDGGWSKEPTSVTLDVQYDYDIRYIDEEYYEDEKKKVTKSTTEGIIGLTVAGTGVYLIWDYFRETQAYQSMREKGYDFQVVNNPGNVSLLVSKIF